jgi:hypothetical protein
VTDLAAAEREALTALLKLVEVPMRYTQSPPLNDRYREREVDADNADFDTSDRVHSLRPGASQRSPGTRHDLFKSEGPSITKRMFRALARFFVAVLIGVCATLAWQSYGDEATEMVRSGVPSIGWLLPNSNIKPFAPAITSAELQQQLKPMAFDLAFVRHSVEQLAANQDDLARKQERIGQNIVTLQAAEQQFIQKASSPPPPKPVHVPPPKIPQIPQPVAQ